MLDLKSNISPPLGAYLSAAALLLFAAAVALPQDFGHGELKLDTGKEIWDAGCATCHGVDGKGAVRTSVGFTTRLPDFTDCAFATKEPDTDWSATIHNGGPARGFSEIMPSFREQLSDEQIDKVISYMRGFCKDKSWPQGDLNLPRALVTEKAFPENETVITTTFNAHGAPGVGNVITFEKRIGSSGQFEAGIPYDFTHENGGWNAALGDITVGYKQKLFHSMRTGSIFSLLGEVTTPTGNTALGTGGESTVFEASAAYGQLLPADSFLQIHTGIELPVHPDLLPKAYYFRTAIGKSFSTLGGLGRTWSPMMEFIADRDLVTGAQTNWDVIPQLQIPLSKRMHILGSVGFRIPVNNTVDRPKQVMFYLLWDFADGSLRQGW
jgi:mono/diheme cytochrome c family protein